MGGAMELEWRRWQLEKGSAGVEHILLCYVIWFMNGVSAYDTGERGKESVLRVKRQAAPTGAW